MNAFSKDYQSVIDWTPLQKEAQISKANAIASRNGAARISSQRIDSVPCRMK